MADRPAGPDAEDTGARTDRESVTGTPRWVKVLGVVTLVVVLLFVALLLAGGAGRHGPGRHGPGRHGGMEGSPPSSVTEHRPPRG